MEYLNYRENGINIVFGITEDRRFKLLHFSTAEFDPESLCRPRPSLWPEVAAQRERLIDEEFQLVQLRIAGLDLPYENHGRKYVLTPPGCYLRYRGLEDTRNDRGRCLVITLEDTEISFVRVIYTMQFYDGTRVVRCRTSVTNIGEEEQTLEYVGSFSYTGIEKEGTGPAEERMYFRLPRNSWQKELNWIRLSFDEMGFSQTQPAIWLRTSRAFEITNTGNWSAKRYLPMGYVENVSAGTSLFWQIEHNGSWHAEIGDSHEHFYLSLSGPTEQQSHWFRRLAPGETFESVPVAVGAGRADFDEDMGELTKYRRLIRRPNRDDLELPVIFNDYMNCLCGDPTAEKEYPMIDVAAECGCEYYVIDAGWYADGEWWDGVGEWKESRKRFPDGLRAVTDYIRKKGMVPGLWLELEVMGVRCPLAETLPDDWFFVRHGKRVYDRSRWQLDFRNPEVRAFADGTVKRLVEEYGAGYIKMDYNIEPGIGTEQGAESPGQGMLEHERAFLAWLDSLYERYPDLVIENCSSGGLRMDYALLSRHSIQSTSDEEDYRNYAVISANAATGCTPEQAAVWSYPLESGDREETIFNMINAMLLRIHQSGHLLNLGDERRALVAEGIRVYKEIRGEIRVGLPFWPTGLAGYRDTWITSGIRRGDRAYLAVWRRDLGRGLMPGEDPASRETDTLRVPLKGLEAYFGRAAASVECIYPPAGEDSAHEYRLDGETHELTVRFGERTMARLYRIEA